MAEAVPAPPTARSASAAACLTMLHRYCSRCASPGASRYAISLLLHSSFSISHLLLPFTSFNHLLWTEPSQLLSIPVSSPPHSHLHQSNYSNWFPSFTSPINKQEARHPTSPLFQLNQPINSMNPITVPPPPLLLVYDPPYPFPCRDQALPSLAEIHHGRDSGREEGSLMWCGC